MRGKRSRLRPWTEPPARPRRSRRAGPSLRDPGRHRRGRLLGRQLLRAGDAASLRERHRRHRLGDRGGRRPQLRDPGRHRRGRLLGRQLLRAGDAASLRGRHRRHRLGDRGGRGHSCAIQAGTGAVVCWGDNCSGQATPPASVNGTAGTASAIAAGAVHSCAIQAGTGAVVCWGDNLPRAGDAASLRERHRGHGLGDRGGLACTAARSRPAPARSSAGARNGYGQATPPPSVNGTAGTASAIAAGWHHSCAIQAGTGAVVCWGDNCDRAGDAACLRGRHRGHRLGDRGGRRPQLRDPGRHRRGRLLGRQLPGEATPPPSVTEPAAPRRRSRRAMGTAARSRPAAARSSAGAGITHGAGDAAAPSVDGTAGPPARAALRFWGEGRTHHSCAIQAGTGAVVCWGGDSGRRPAAAAASAFRRTAPPAPPRRSRRATYDSCAIQAGTGAVVCWGWTLRAGDAPPSVDGTTGTASAIAAGDVHSCAIQAGTGAVVCWGYNYTGQTDTPPPVDGTAGTATAVSASGNHSCAIQAGTNRVVCWGHNAFLQSAPPSSVDGTAGTASAIDAGWTHTLAIRKLATPVPSLSPAGVAAVGSLMLLAGGYALRRRRG